MPGGRERLSDRALNRALLARQGLLERFDAPVVDVVEAIGAMQGQAWSALPVGLWSRMRSFVPGDLYAALESGQLRWGIGLRGTLHLVSAREHPAYAVVAHPATAAWARALEQTSAGMDALRAALLEFAGSESRTNEQIREFAELWVADHPQEIDAAEVDAQRALNWRPIYRWSALTRVPNGGVWGTKAPPDHLAVPIPPASRRAPSADQAIDDVARRHLRAFGPAAVEDIACWTGKPTPPLRELIGRVDGELVSFEDDHGRTLYDLPDAPRPDPETPAPARLLGAFDSTLLAYASKRRERIMPDALRDFVYQKANLQIRPSFLVDGLVAGTWAAELRRREATLTLRPAGRLGRPAARELTAESEGLLAALYPTAKAHHVVID
jgi:winged helix DNA-binding protein